jgi:hypothetical protein
VARDRLVHDQAAHPDCLVHPVAGALAGALLLRVDVALPVLAAAVVIALAVVALRFGR